jgi:hypothetical protein
MKRAFAIILVMVVCLFPRTQANGQRSGLTPGAAPAASADTQHSAHAGYAGDDPRSSCHADQFASYHQTAHYRTSTTPESAPISSNLPLSRFMKRKFAMVSLATKRSIFPSLFTSVATTPHALPR